MSRWRLALVYAAVAAVAAPMAAGTERKTFQKIFVKKDGKAAGALSGHAAITSSLLGTYIDYRDKNGKDGHSVYPMIRHEVYAAVVTSPDSGESYHEDYSARYRNAPTDGKLQHERLLTDLQPDKQYTTPSGYRSIAKICSDDRYDGDDCTSAQATFDAP